MTPLVTRMTGVTSGFHRHTCRSAAPPLRATCSCRPAVAVARHLQPPGRPVTPPRASQAATRSLLILGLRSLGACRGKADPQAHRWVRPRGFLSCFTGLARDQSPLHAAQCHRERSVPNKAAGPASGLREGERGQSNDLPGRGPSVDSRLSLPARLNDCVERLGKEAGGDPGVGATPAGAALGTWHRPAPTSGLQPSFLSGRPSPRRGRSPAPE